MVSRVRIKMCGMTRHEDIKAAAMLGVDAVGLIFYAPSPRSVTLEKASQLLTHFPALMSTVAVFVNPEPKMVDDVLSELPIQYVQFHGDETPEFCGQFSIPYIKAIPAVSKEQIMQMTGDYSHAAALLLDTPSKTQRGGSGATFDWTIIPERDDFPLILAGGLNVQNVHEALKFRSFYGVDVCSGVEASPGIKSYVKMKHFVENSFKPTASNNDHQE